MDLQPWRHDCTSSKLYVVANGQNTGCGCLTNPGTRSMMDKTA